MNTSPFALKPGSPASPPAPRTQLADFGAKIGGARKDRGEAREDPGEGGGEFLRADVTRKALWPPPDYAALVAEGLSPLAAKLRQRVRELVGPGPWPRRGQWTQIDKFDFYRRGIEVIRRVTETIHSRKDVEGGTLVRRLEAEFGTAGFTGRNLEVIGAVVCSRYYVAHRFRMSSEEVDALEAEIARTGWPAPAGAFWTKLVPLGYQRTREDADGVTVLRTADQREKTFPDLRAVQTWAYGRFPALKTAGGRTQNPEPEEVPHLAIVRRYGLPEHRPDGNPVNAETFLATFHVRGVEFGNWLDGQERQEVLDRAYDALMDLAAALSWNPSDLSLGGRLALAFGSRGHGGRRAALAHFEPAKFVLNLTRLKGAGTLAHEFFHAWDCMLGGLAGNEVRRPYATQGWRVDKKEVELIEVLRVAGALTRQLKLGANPGESTLLRNARRLDAKRSKPYWATPHELAARAFTAFVEDRLAEQGGVNEYLCHSTRANGAPPETAQLYPQGTERSAADTHLRQLAGWTAAFSLCRFGTEAPPAQGSLAA